MAGRISDVASMVRGAVGACQLRAAKPPTPKGSNSSAQGNALGIASPHVGRAPNGVRPFGAMARYRAAMTRGIEPRCCWRVDLLVRMQEFEKRFQPPVSLYAALFHFVSAALPGAQNQVHSSYAVGTIDFCVADHTSWSSHRADNPPVVN